MKTALRNKRILIIGSSRGMGLKIAQFLQKHSDEIIISSSNKKNIEIAYSNLIKLKNTNLNIKKIHKLKIDIANFSSINQTSKKLKKIFIKIDVVIFSAASLGPSGKIENNNFSSWCKTFDTNIFGPVKMIQCLIKNKSFIDNSKIIFISGGISSPDPYFTSFNASKHALNGFTISLSEQLYQNNIWVNSILPGSYHTQMNKIRIKRGPKQIGERNFKIAKSRINQNESKLYDNLNRLIKFLCSNKSNKVTGRVISAQYDNWEDNIGKIKKSENELYKIVRKK